MRRVAELGSLGVATLVPMTTKTLILLLLCCSTFHLHAAPQPYAWEIVYRSASPERPTSPSDIRQQPASKREIDIDFLGFLRTIRWEDSKSDPAIKRKAGPIVMIVDCYDRVQPEPPSKPRFDTLYITRTHIYSGENLYLKISPQIRTALDSAFAP